MPKAPKAPDEPGLEPSPVPGETRSEMHSRIIPKIVESCHYDMDAGAIFGRVMSRLKANGATDQEIAEKITEIREASDKHVAERTLDANARAQRKAARDAAAIDKALEA